MVYFLLVVPSCWLVLMQYNLSLYFASKSCFSFDVTAAHPVSTNSPNSLLPFNQLFKSVNAIEVKGVDEDVVAENDVAEDDVLVVVVRDDDDVVDGVAFVFDVNAYIIMYTTVPLK